MKLNKQVTTLETSKKLKELGVKQESLFGWYRGLKGLNDNSYQVKINNRPMKRWSADYSAFTVAELGEKLPKFKLRKYSKNYEIYIPDRTIFHQVAKNPSNCLAKMLIYLIENKLIECGGIR